MGQAGLRAGPSQAFLFLATYTSPMNNRAKSLRAFFRGLARVQQTFTIEVGPLRASGVPAILIGVTGILVASGVTIALSKGATRLPETLGEARGLAEALNSGRSPRLKS
jgi:hypothetical protein